MTPRGGPLLHEPGGDNTPQGKLTRGCGWVIMWIVVAIVLGGLVDAAEHWFCDYQQAWYCKGSR